MGSRASASNGQMVGTTPYWFTRLFFYFLPEPDIAHPGRIYIVDLTKGKVLL